MNKEEILAKSRQENKNMDMYEMEVNGNTGTIGAIAGCLAAFILYFTQIFIGGGVNYSLWAVMSIMCSAVNIYKAVKLKSSRFTVKAVIWTFTAIIVTGLALFYLFKNAGGEKA